MPLENTLAPLVPDHNFYQQILVYFVFFPIFHVLSYFSLEGHYGN